MLAGLAAVAAIPVAILVAERGDRITLLQSAVSIAPAFGLSIAAVYLGRRARTTSERTLGRVRGSSLARIGRILGYVGLYIAVTASISVATYYVLRQIA